MPLSPKKVHEQLLAHALSYPESHEAHPWGEVVAKVNGKVFVFFGVEKTRADAVFLCVKLPESGSVLLDQDWAEPTGYGLGKSGWVSITFPRGEIPPVEVMQDWIEESYRAVAPRRAVAALDGEEVRAAPVRRKKKAKATTRRRALATVREKTSKPAREAPTRVGRKKAAVKKAVKKKAATTKKRAKATKKKGTARKAGARKTTRKKRG